MKPTAEWQRVFLGALRSGLTGHLNLAISFSKCEGLTLLQRKKAMHIEHGHFDHGGVKLVKLYLDKDNKTTTKKYAVKVKCIEYDSASNVVFDAVLPV